MATTGSGYVRPAMPIPRNASPNHCTPAPSILLNPTSPLPSRSRGRSISSVISHLGGRARSVSAASNSSSASRVPTATSEADGSGTAATASSPDGAVDEVSKAGTSPRAKDMEDGAEECRPRRNSVVHFAPLPEVPPELKRRSSITLGVAARKNLLSSQGGAAGVKTGVVYMNDADWELYKKQYEAKHGDDIPDLGDLVASGVKSLWKKVRSSSHSSNSSAGTSASFNQVRKGSALATSPPVSPVSTASTLATVSEEGSVSPQSRSPVQRLITLDGLALLHEEPTVVMGEIPSGLSSGQASAPEVDFGAWAHPTAPPQNAAATDTQIRNGEGGVAHRNGEAEHFAPHISAPDLEGAEEGDGAETPRRPSTPTGNGRLRKVPSETFREGKGGGRQAAVLGFDEERYGSRAGGRAVFGSMETG